MGNGSFPGEKRVLPCQLHFILSRWLAYKFTQ